MKRFWLSWLVLAVWTLAIRIYINHLPKGQFVRIGDYGTWPLVLPLPIGIALVWVVPWLAGRDGRAQDMADEIDGRW